MRKRNVRVWARLDEGEFDAIMRRVRRTGLSREAYIRSVLLGSVPREKPDERFYSLMNELGGMAASVGRLSRNAATFSPADAQMLKSEADKWGRFQLEVRRSVLLPEKLLE